MKDRTAKNVHEAFIGEAKAYQRLLMFAKKAEEEELPQIAHLFRAVAAAEVYSGHSDQSREGVPIRKRSKRSPLPENATGS
jgi:rubrerythrin